MFTSRLFHVWQGNPFFKRKLIGSSRVADVPACCRLGLDAPTGHIDTFTRVQGNGEKGAALLVLL